MTKINTIKVVGYGYERVSVECSSTPGIGIHVVGLADNAVKESLLRATTAMHSLGYSFPNKKIEIRLSPVDKTKSGTGYDLPIAVAMIAESGQVELPDIDKYVIVGELGLDGSVRDVPGWMQAAQAAKDAGLACIMPARTAKLAANVFLDNATIYAVYNLPDVVKILSGDTPEYTALDLEERVIDVWQAQELLLNSADELPIRDRIYEFVNNLFQESIAVIEGNNEILDSDGNLADYEHSNETMWYDDVQERYFQSVYDRIAGFFNKK